MYIYSYYYADWNPYSIDRQSWCNGHFAVTCKKDFSREVGKDFNVCGVLRILVIEPISA